MKCRSDSERTGFFPCGTDRPRAARPSDHGHWIRPRPPGRVTARASRARAPGRGTFECSRPGLVCSESGRRRVAGPPSHRSGGAAAGCGLLRVPPAWAGRREISNHCEERYSCLVGKEFHLDCLPCFYNQDFINFHVCFRVLSSLPFFLIPCKGDSMTASLMHSSSFDSMTHF